MKKKYVPRPETFWNPGAVEQWLEEMALKGWKMDSCGPRLMSFARMEPQVCRVRLHPMAADEAWIVGVERRDLYGDMGWEYVGDTGEHEVYYCTDPGAPELETDPVVQKWAWEKGLMRYSRGYFIGLLLIAVIVTALVYFVFAGGQPVETLLTGNVMSFLVLLMLPWLLIDGVRELRRIRRLRRELAAGVSMSHAGNTRQMRRQANRGFVLLLLMWVSLLVVNPLSSLLLEETGGLKTMEDSVSYVAAETLDPERFDEALRTHDYATKKQTLLAPERCTVREQYPQQALVLNDFDRLRMEFLAEWLYEEKLDQWRALYGDDAVTILEDARFDRAILLEWQGVQGFLAQKDRVVYSLWSNTPVELEAHLETYCDLMI